MSFSSLFFTAGFLPLFLLIYTAVPGVRRKNRVLLCFSLLFYLAGGLHYLLLLLLMTALSFGFGYLIEERRGERRWFVIGISLLLLNLAFFKYSAFFLRPLLPLLPFHLPGALLPLGISFYSFRLISYLSDIQSGRLRAQSFGSLLLYTADFHIISQGPIVRFREMEAALRERRMSPEDFCEGMFRFCLGLSKKTLLADHAGKLAGQFLPLDFLHAASQGNPPSVLASWLGGIFYMLQIYLDFSAYSDMALGLGRVCGFDYPENFDYPYAAHSVRDFWRRWHISLSSFFRDYVYIPLGGSHVSLPKLCRNLLLVWALTGLWHGASWNFVLWGLYYFFFIMIENLRRRREREELEEERVGTGEEGERKEEEKDRDGEEKPEEKAAESDGGKEGRGFPGFRRQSAGERGKRGRETRGRRLLSHLYTLLVVYFGWILFRFSDFHALIAALKLQFGIGASALWDPITALNLWNNLIFFFACLLASTPLFHYIGISMQNGLQQSLSLRRKEERRSERIRDNESFGDDSLQLFDRESEAEAENEHEIALRRIQLRARRRKRALRRAAFFYYLERGAAALLFLALSVMAMVGSSYMPFLYNQF